MAEVVSPTQVSLPPDLASTKQTTIPPKHLVPPPVTLPPQSAVRSGHLSLDTFSPVNQNGSFAFDRVIKNGEVHKRTRKTKQWKSFHLVLRPNLISLYKSRTEERLLKQLALSDLTAVTYLKDPKGRREHLFGLFSPSRNWHLQAQSAAEARSWVELIKQEARIDEEEKELLVASPTYSQTPQIDPLGNDRFESDRIGSSSPEPSSRLSTTTRDGVKIPGIRRPSAAFQDYSGDEIGPYSDFSDTPPQSFQQPSTFGSLMSKKLRQPPVVHHQTPYTTPLDQQTARKASQTSGLQAEHQDEERVIWHGYLLYLKSKGGVRQWKRTWVVLRPKHLAFYKNDEEYAANLILPLTTVISAVEIDPISKSKKHCMQIITADRSYRFCAPSEDALAEWLGALKSHLAKKKEKDKSLPP